jgi:hypothetical protein
VDLAGFTGPNPASIVVDLGGVATASVAVVLYRRTEWLFLDEVTFYAAD